MNDAAPPQPARVAKPRLRGWRLLAVYAFFVLVSNIADWQADEARRVWGGLYLDKFDAVELEVDVTGLPVRENPLAYRVIVSGSIDPSEPPVMLLHGSPGAANGFEALAGELYERGRTAIWLDLPGFASQSEPWSHGRVFDDYSADTYADIMVRVLDALGVERTHIVGWSNSGAVGLRMVESDPERVASLTMLAAVGSQDTEGSGVYATEHLKYKLGKALLVYGAKLIPHFGILGPASERRAFLEFFDDTDQRPLAQIMAGSETPTLVLHGRDDFLVPAWGAERHQEQIASSRLVMLDSGRVFPSGHFLPFLASEMVSDHLVPFIERHDEPGVPPETGVLDLAPVSDRGTTARALHDVAIWLRALPWWVLIPVFGVLVRWKPVLGVLLIGTLVATGRVDFAIGGLGVLAGRAWWGATTNPIDRPHSRWVWGLGWVRLVGWALVSFVLSWLVFGQTAVGLTDRFGLIGLVVALLVGWVMLKIVRLAWSREGRHRIRAGGIRLRRQEYWNGWVHYAPTIARIPIWWWRAGRRAVLTAVNPGYAEDGGLASEKKHEVLARLDDPTVLHGVLVDQDADRNRRIDRGVELSRDPALGGFPMVAKPDQGERGRAVRLVRSEEDVRAYLESHPEPVLLQRFHAGPVEIGAVWIRDPETIRNPGAPGAHGRVRWVTRKVLPEMVGDGRSTVRELILGHPRYACQARCFLDRVRERLDHIPEEGARVRLGAAGNHSQGAMFTDGADLITPELEACLDRVARSLEGGFDIGRFDIRAESEDHIRRGEGLAIIELNGVTSEPTNIYDPSWSIRQAQGTLLEYWSSLIELGMVRMETGTGAPISMVRVFRGIVEGRLRSRNGEASS